ncbi:MAG TPA: hypothetical protein VFR01_00325, partial [Geobacterales bacterium]|nr:hypothetical protein [Geobacterales bacterium]
MLRNPEFRRNLWLEMTPYRLVGMPLVLAPLFYLVGKINDFDSKSLVGTAVSLYFILAILWGTRLASEAVLSEIRDQTWDSQRLSAISPWQMTWGKLFGATA